MQNVILHAPWNLGRIDGDLLQDMHASLSIYNPDSNPTAQVVGQEVCYSNNKTAVFEKFVSLVVGAVLPKERSINANSILTIVPARKLVYCGETSAVVASNWHCDSRRYLVSSALPTEFLVGEVTIPIDHVKYPYPYYNGDSFKKIESNFVFAPHVGDITGLDTTHTHRAAVNATTDDVDRMFIQVFAS